MPPNTSPDGAVSDASDVDAWAARVAAVADLGDARLNQRLAVVLSAFARNPGCSIPQACANRAQAKAAYRFFDHEHVTLQRLTAPLAADTVRACAGRALIYAVQDTTTLNYSTLRATTGLGPLNDSEWARGLHLHTTLAVDERGIVRGVLDLQIWSRPEGERATELGRERPIEDKESVKWLDGIAAARRAFAALPTQQRPRLVHVMDAEGDIHEVLETIVAHGEGALIRSAQNRNIAGAHHHAYPAVRQTPSLGNHLVHLAARDGKPARTAQVEVRALDVTLVSSKNHAHRQPVPLTLIEAWEPQAPQGSEPVCWHLWVIDAVATLEQAVVPLTRYGFRWRVEDFHTTLKSGCQAEKLELETAERLSNALALYAGVAARIVGLRDLAQRDPNGSCTQILQEDEWRVLTLRFGDPAATDVQPPTLRQALLWIGRLGGHQGCRRARLPGVKTLWRGWRDLMLLVAGYRLRHRPRRRACGT